MSYLKELILKINSFLKRDNFKNLPFNYQRSVIIRAFEVNENIEWSITAPINWLKDKLEIEALINDYYSTYPKREFYYGVVPINLIIDRVMLIDDISVYGSFENYHKSYGDPGIKSNEILPILVSDSEEEYIEDGWHRFHMYYDQGLKEIPIVKY